MPERIRFAPEIDLALSDTPALVLGSRPARPEPILNRGVELIVGSSGHTEGRGKTLPD